MQLNRAYHEQKAIDLMSINSWKDAKAHLQVASKLPAKEGKLTLKQITDKINLCNKKMINKHIV